MSDEIPGVAVFMFDVSHQTLSADEINAKISKHPNVVEWWNYIPGCYLLRLTCEPYVLTDYLEGVNGFLLGSLDPMTLSGKLSKLAWDQLFNGLMKDRAKEMADTIIARRGHLPFDKKK